jgi:hypothetical protein
MAGTLWEHFADMPDPRRAQGRRHALSDMIVLAVTAVVCGADSWADVQEFAEAKRNASGLDHLPDRLARRATSTLARAAIRGGGRIDPRSSTPDGKP